MADRELAVIIARQRAGTLFQRPNGGIGFEYDPGYERMPLSLSMPVANRVYRDRNVRPYLLGLLPDNLEVRRAIGREYGVSGNNPFSLLAHECESIVRQLAADIPVCLSRAFDSVADVSGANDLRASLEPAVVKQCDLVEF